MSVTKWGGGTKWRRNPIVKWGINPIQKSAIERVTEKLKA